MTTFSEDASDVFDNIFTTKNDVVVKDEDTSVEFRNQVSNAEIRAETFYDHRGAAIAQWVCLCLPFAAPGLSPSTPSMLLSFIVKLVLYLSCEKYEKKQKEAGLGTFKKHFPLVIYNSRVILTKKCLEYDYGVVNYNGKMA